MKSRIDMWESLAVAVASNPRVRTGKQAKAMIDFLLKERDSVIAEVMAVKPACLPRANRHDPMPDGSCSCAAKT